MRGDSIRDRYAKALALLGLGMLAGTGALVDYWPTNGRLPLVGTPDRDPFIETATARVDPLTIRVSPPAVRPQALPVRATVSTFPAIQVSAALPLAGEPVFLAAPPPAEVAPLPEAPVTLVAAVHSPVVVGTMASALILPPLATPRYDVDWSDEADTDGFLTGTVKRTGATIIRTSARAGASVFDAFRSLGGTLRRALPN